MQHHCHHCEYELLGLPDKGHCPECGQPYNKHSNYRAAQSREPAWVRHIQWVSLAAFTAMVLVCGGALSIKADNPFSVIAVTLFVAGVSGFGAFAYWWSQRQERREAD